MQGSQGFAFRLQVRRVILRSPYGAEQSTFRNRCMGAIFQIPKLELPPPARKTIDLEGRIVKDGVKKAIRDRQLALTELVHAIRRFRKIADSQPLTLISKAPVQDGADDNHGCHSVKRYSGSLSVLMNQLSHIDHPGHTATVRGPRVRSRIGQHGQSSPSASSRAIINDTSDKE